MQEVPGHMKKRIRIRKKLPSASREERLIARILLLENKLGVTEGINENLRSVVKRYQHEGARMESNYAELRRVVEHHDPELYKNHQRWVQISEE